MMNGDRRRPAKADASRWCTVAAPCTRQRDHDDLRRHCDSVSRPTGLLAARAERRLQNCCRPKAGTPPSDDQSLHEPQQRVLRLPQLRLLCVPLPRLADATASCAIAIRAAGRSERPGAAPACRTLAATIVKPTAAAKSWRSCITPV